MQHLKISLLKPERTEEAKRIRRLIGDNGGVRFANRVCKPHPPIVSNTISTVLKDNLLLYEYEDNEHRTTDHP